MERILIMLIYVALGATTGIQKLSGDFPPSWFMEKFKDSLIGLIPGGIALSFLIIVILEIALAMLFLTALFKREFANGKEKVFSRLGFYVGLLLFLILFFGSFLIQDYDNGFLDFAYFGITVLLMNYFMSEETKST